MLNSIMFNLVQNPPQIYKAEVEVETEVEAQGAELRD